VMLGSTTRVIANKKAWKEPLEAEKDRDMDHAVRARSRPRRRWAQDERAEEGAEGGLRPSFLHALAHDLAPDDPSWVSLE